MIYKIDRIKKDLLNLLRSKVTCLRGRDIIPSLAIIRLGHDQSDLSYEKGIEKSAESIGICLKKFLLNEGTSTDEVVEIVSKLNKDPNVGGILIFRPLPSHIDEERISRAIDPSKDVDCISPRNQVKLLIGKKGKLPATAISALRILKDICPNLEGKNVLIVNRSMVIGKPLAHMLLNENATVTLAHSRTKNLKDFMKGFEIIILATGQAQMIDSSYISESAIVIDCGISFKEGKLCGDADTEDLRDKAAWVSSVPGGVGALTNLSLLESVLEYFDGKTQV